MAAAPKRAIRKLLAALGPGAQRDLAIDILRNVGPHPDLETAWPVVEDLLQRSETEARLALYARVREFHEADVRAVPYAVRVFGHQRAWTRQYVGSLEGLRVLELGPGHSLINGVLYALHGAARYEAVDLEPLATLSEAPYRALRARLAQAPLVSGPSEDAGRAAALARFDEVVQFAAGGVRLDPERVAYRTPVDAAELPFPDGAFDVVHSNAAFEHFADPPAAIRETYRVLRPGGVGVHVIDFRDHRDFSRPLEFLTLSEQAWAARVAAGGEYTNRWRIGRYAAAFVEAGFTIEERDIQRTEVVEELRARLAPPFRDLPDEELTALGARFVVRRA